MTEQRVPVVFLDSNVLIQALLNSLPALSVLDLATSRVIEVVTCQLVVRDAEREILARHSIDPEQLTVVIEFWQAILERTRLRVIPDPSMEMVLECRQKFLATMRHLADIPVLAGAIEANVDIIISGNRKHFNDATAARAGIPMYSCTEFLAKMEEPHH